MGLGCPDSCPVHTKKTIILSFPSLYDILYSPEHKWRYSEDSIDCHFVDMKPWRLSSKTVNDATKCVNDNNSKPPLVRGRHAQARDRAPSIYFTVQKMCAMHFDAQTAVPN